MLTCNEHRLINVVFSSRKLVIPPIGSYRILSDHVTTIVSNSNFWKICRLSFFSTSCFASFPFRDVSNDHKFHEKFIHKILFLHSDVGSSRGKGRETGKNMEFVENNEVW